MMIVFLGAYLFFLYVPMKRSLHMYQQNRYRYERYHVWLRQAMKRKRKTILNTFLALFLCYGLLLVSHEDLPQLLLILLVLIFSYLNYKVEEEQVYRKPLNMTARIKRLMVAMFLFHALLLGFLYILGNVVIWIVLTPFLHFVPWFSINLVGWGMLPIENGIQNVYVREAKERLRQQSDLCCIGITGSYGKTSVKNILFHLLSEKWMTIMTPQSYNNRMGITLTIRKQLKALDEVFLCEMGADHVHDIETLMDFVQPSMGIVTAVGPQHLLTFHTMDNILHEKMKMIEKLPIDGIGFLNADNEYIRSYPLRNHCRIVWFGNDSIAHYRYANITYQPEGTQFTIYYEDEAHAFQTKLLGEHNVINITAAIAVAHTMGIDWSILQTAVESLPYVSHRLEKIKTKTYTMIDDAYNSNPSGARYALAVMRKMKGKRILVTPGFIDLGKEQEKENYRLGLDIVGCVDEVLLVGKIQTASIYAGLAHQHFDMQKVHVVDDIHEAFALLETIANQDSIVLLENDLPDAFNY